MSEPLVQLTDENGTVTGVAAMLDAFEKELVRHTVYVLLANSHGTFLLQKRSAGAPNYSSYWDASAGGHIDEGEVPEQAAYRELKEELGIEGLQLQLVYSFYFESEGDGRTYRYFAHVYTGTLPSSGIPELISNEVDDVKLFTRDEIHTLDKVTPITRHIVTLL